MVTTYIFFNSPVSEPTISFLTAAPPIYGTSFNPDLANIEAHSSGEAISKPLNNTAPY